MGAFGVQAEYPEKENTGGEAMTRHAKQAAMQTEVTGRIMMGRATWEFTNSPRPRRQYHRMSTNPATAPGLHMGDRVSQGRRTAEDRGGKADDDTHRVRTRFQPNHTTGTAQREGAKREAALAASREDWHCPVDETTSPDTGRVTPAYSSTARGELQDLERSAACAIRARFPQAHPGSRHALATISYTQAVSHAARGQKGRANQRARPVQYTYRTAGSGDWFFSGVASRLCAASLSPVRHGSGMAVVWQWYGMHEESG